MSRWPEFPLESFVDQSRSICYGIVQPGKPREGGVPIVRVNNLRDGRVDPYDALEVDPEIERRYQRSRLEGGELLVTLVGTMGLSAIVPDELRGWNVARAVGVVPLKNGIDKRWINFVLRSQPSQEFIRAHANTTVQATFNLRDLARLPVPMPPKDVRAPASDLLSALDDKIELNRRVNETLEKMARSIFEDWFVEFGPTRAKAKGINPYLPPGIWDLFPGALGDDGRPSGWCAAELSSLATLNPETWSAKKHPERIDYVDLASTRWGVVEEVQELDWEESPSRARRVLRRGDTIVGTVRPGNGAYSYVGGDGLTGSTGFAVLRPKTPAHREVVYLAATAHRNIERLAHLADGAAYPAVRPDVVSATEIVAPDSDAVFEEFSSLVSPLVEQLDTHKRESGTLAAIRDFLLPKLISGEIRLKDAEKTVESVA